MISVVFNETLNTPYEIQTLAIHLSNCKNTEKPSLKDTENMQIQDFFLCSGGFSKAEDNLAE